jgi:hypothetical protein
MKRSKLFALALGATLVLVAILAMLAFSSPVQTWAARKALAGQPGLSGEIGRVSAGLSRAELNNVRIVQDGVVVTLGVVDARYSAWDYLTKRRLNVTSVTVRDLAIDLRNATPSPSPEPAGEPFRGILSHAELPVDLHLARFELDGHALLPDHQVARFTAIATDLGTGRRGRIEWTAEFTHAIPDAPLQTLRARGVAVINTTAERRIDNVELDATAIAEGPKLPRDELKLSAKANQPAAGGDESYSVAVALIRPGRQAESLLGGTARYDAATREFAGAWEISVRTEQLATLLAGLGLPEVAAIGAGQFAFNPSTSAASANGELEIDVTRLEALSPQLSPVGAMRLQVAFASGFSGDVAELERLQLHATTADGRQLAQVRTAQPVGFNLSERRAVFADATSELARVAVQELPLAWAQPFLEGLSIDQGTLSLQLAIEAEPDGSRVRARSMEPLRVQGLTVRQGEHLLADRMTLTLQPSIDYTSERIIGELTQIHLSTPAGDTITGQLGATITDPFKTRIVTFRTQVQAELIEAYRPYLPLNLNPGRLSAHLRSEGRLAGTTLDLAQAQATMHRDGAALLAAFELRQAVAIDLEKTTLVVPQPTATAARVTLGEIPLAWAETFVENAKLSGVFTGTTLDVALRSLDDATVTTAAPLTFRGVTVALGGKPTLQGLDLAGDLTATKRGSTVAYDVRRLELRQGDAVLATLAAVGEAGLGDAMTLTAKGQLEADIAALLKQPVASEFATLSRGRVTSTFDAQLTDTVRAQASVALRNLVARKDNQPLGDLELTLTATAKPDGSSGTVRAPLTLTQAGRRSDVIVDATFGKATDRDTLIFTGKVAGKELYVDDFQALATLAPETPPSRPAPSPTIGGPRPTTPPAPTRDSEPFWKGKNGKLELDLAKVVYGKDYVISHVRGTATITDSRLAFEGLEGRFNNEPFRLDAGVAFDARQAKPYALTGVMNVAGFDLGQFLRAANPKQPPAVESRLAVAANLSGNGATITDLAKGVYGRFELTGSGGVLRALGRKGQAVGAVSSIVGLIGAARGSNTTAAIAELTSAFNELRFDRFAMQLERGADLNIKVTSLEFISPFMRAIGAGAITATEGAPVENQPMRINLQFGAKDSLAALLSRAGALSEKQDEQGYHLMSKSFTVGGSASNPDSSSLWGLLAEAAASAAARALSKPEPQPQSQTPEEPGRTP